MFETTENLEYKKEALKIILVSEGFKKLPYNDKAKKDGSGYLTIGYGINLQVRDWLIAVLNELGIFGDITTLDSVADIRALDNTDNKAMIDNFYGITKKIVTDDTISATQTQLNTLLRKHKGVNSGNFEITKEQGLNIKEIVSETIFNGVATVNDKTLKINKETNEYAGILSYAFNVGLQSQEYLFRECNKDNNSRFLSFFTLRYGVNFLLNNDNAKFGIAKRRFWESRLFGFEYNGNNAFKTAIGIFKILNFKYKPRFILKNYNDNFIKNFKESLNQTYLDWIVNYEDKLLYAKKDKNQTWQEFYNADAKTNNLTENFSNIQGITPDKDNILSPYLDYLNTLTQKTFSLENIYCIQSFYGNLGAKKLTNVASINKILSQRFSNNSKQPQPTTQDSTAQANPAQSTAENPAQILILYPNPTPLPIQIIQPPNTFLTLVLGKNAKLDCSKLIVGQCAILYLEYDEKEKESTQNPKLTALKSNAILTLNTQDSITYEASHNNLTYTISKNDGVLKVSLKDKREQAIELYNFAKENEYRILKDCASQMLDIQLKLQDNKELSTSYNGNFNLTINNFLLLDSKGKNLDITTKQDFTLYLHNCENRQVYTSTTITKNPNSDTYSVTFHFDLILEETSNLFKRTTKLIVATQNLANDFSTSEIHSKGNVAIISLSSADKKGESYTFSKLVSAQEFESQAIQTTHQYLASNDDRLAYEVAFGEGEGDIIPTLSTAQDRKQSIINDTPAIFNIEGYERDLVNNIPWYQLHTQEEVTENNNVIDKIIDKNAQTNNINHNRLIRAIIYLETTHGYYDAINPMNKSFRPMNVNYDYWKEWINKMGYTKEQVKNNKKINIKIGYALVAKILERIQNPTIEKVGTIYNVLGKEKISSYGKVLKYYYDNESWLKPKPPTLKDLLEYIKDNPPSIKGF